MWSRHPRLSVLMRAAEVLRIPLEQLLVAQSIAALREQGVLFLDGPDGYASHPPKRGNPSGFPWPKALAALPGGAVA
jgi:hypothetical protein